MTLLKPWVPIVDPGKIQDQLKSEVTPGHLLFAIPVKAIAHRQDCDDFLFSLMDGSGRFAVVHLVFSKSIDPRWPETEIFSSYSGWLAARMLPDHADFNA